jgi:hypothetical protein
MITEKSDVFTLRDYAAFIFNQIFAAGLVKEGLNLEKAGKITISKLVKIAIENFGCLTETISKDQYNWDHYIQNQNNKKPKNPINEEMTLGSMINQWGGKTKYMVLGPDNDVVITNVAGFEHGRKLQDYEIVDLRKRGTLVKFKK